MAPIFGQQCGFDNLRQHKVHSKHTLGITLLLSCSVSKHVEMRSLQHSNIKTHECYKSLTNDNIDRKYKAMNPLLHFKEPPSEPMFSQSKQKISNLPVKESNHLMVNSNSSNIHFISSTFNSPSSIVININPSHL